MSSESFAIPRGVRAIDPKSLDTRADFEVDQEIASFRPVVDEKNVWMFWHSGWKDIPGYHKRGVRAWHRRLARLGWHVRVVDRNPGSPHNIAKYVDVNDASLFPVAFRDQTLNGRYAMQHTSDLVRWPLLLTYGGVYADVGLLQIGDLDRLWNETLGNPASPYEVMSYATPDETLGRFGLANYFLCCNKGNALFSRAHKVFLALWAEDGGKTNTEGMHASAIMKDIPLSPHEGSFTEDGVTYGPEDIGRLLADYIIQGQALTLAMYTRDDADNWDGPAYCAKHVYGLNFMVGSQLINEYTAWDGKLAFELMSLPIATNEEEETEKQKQARIVVEGCLSRSFGFKLATGLILRVLGPTLSSLWRDNPGSDDVEGTYARWLRHGTAHWQPVELPSKEDWPVLPPLRHAPLLD